MDTNVLYYGDNLEISRKYIPDNSIDLIYLDPPFNSKAAYNVLFKEPTGESSQAQITAFDDTWHWGRSAVRSRSVINSESFPYSVLLPHDQPVLLFCHTATIPVLILLSEVFL
jgi:adenine specific DNA methylase Mod